MEIETIQIKELDFPPEIVSDDMEKQWREATGRMPRKIVVLDDDPTGVQTVHDVPVYTSWEPADCRKLLREPGRVVFLLTNSRALSCGETKELHRKIAENLKRELPEAGLQKSDLLLVLRGDSTLRAHYPVEMDTVAETFYGTDFPDGEIHIPAFMEGGRYTLHGIHYVRQQDTLIPAGQTEFADDPLFGYKNSQLGRWICEKRKEEYRPEAFVFVDIGLLRSGDTAGVTELIMKAEKGARIVVDAMSYRDLKQFCISLAECMDAGKHYILRTGASAIGVLGGIPGKPLLRREEINPERRAGVVIAGSFVNKTTQQLAALREEEDLCFYEADVRRILHGDLEQEIATAARQIDEALDKEKTICIYTSRGYYGAGLGEQEKIDNSKKISGFLIRVVRAVSRRPGYLVAKGGITSSDIGVKGLGVTRAIVAGQAEAGVPVWKTGDESLFPGMSYIIFPGNVGDRETLRDLVRRLDSKGA